MIIATTKSESLASEQQAALEAIDNLCDEIRNHDHFSNADIAQILSEVKGVHGDYKAAFKEPAFAWQVKCYMMQMALENKFRFIFQHDEKMTWTSVRWKYALLTELGIRYYKEIEKGMEIVIPKQGLKLMALWLFFQYFKASVFTGPQCMEVIEMAFQIVKDEDSAIRESVQMIKQWRRDNDEKIQSINYQKTEWRREVAKYDRLIHGRMRLKEVEIHHIFYWCYQNWPFEWNVRVASRNLGVSERGVKKILREHGVDENNLRGYLYVYKEEQDAIYEKEFKWAEKVRSKTLTKKERKSFWRKHSIQDTRSIFRTFSVPDEDLIPHTNPLLTDETCVAPKPDNSALAAVREGKMNGCRSPQQMASPLQMGSLSHMGLLTPCFNSMDTKSETITI